MTLDEYQQAAMKTAIDTHNTETEFFHRMLGLVGEAGELAEKVKKIMRDHKGDLSKLDHDDLKKELGDVMWYVATLAHWFEFTLEDVGRSNIEKLADRQNRGVLDGSGDNR